ncbi:MAG: hypothetical protein WCG04_01740 [Alphaproteobacteria bacterium]
MITIYNLQGRKLKSIPNDDEFFNHISAGELLEDHTEVEQTHRWSFMVFSSEIEICEGEFANPRLVAITPDLNIGALKKAWYLEYCKAHGYALHFQ